MPKRSHPLVIDTLRVPPPDPVRERPRAVRALWAASALGGLAQSLAGTAGALLARQVGGSDSVAGLPQAALVVGAALSALALSAITRRRGRGAALSAGAGAAVAGCLVVVLAGLAGNLPGIVVGSLLLGSGQTAVMLGRYAAADLGPEASRAGAMASVLVATTVGAVAGPNLLAPSGVLAVSLGMPCLVGPYVVAALGFASAAAALTFGLGIRRSVPAGSIHVAAAAGVTGPGLGRHGAVGLAVLGVSNVVMVAVMTMAPVQLHHVGVGLGALGLVVSLHIAGMFAPSLVSGWLTDRYGAVPVAAGAGVVLTLACTLAVVGATSPILLSGALLLLGVGWNLGLVAGSVLITAGVPAVDRPRREGWGEVAMGAAAAGGGAGSGLMVAAGGYPTLATAGATVAALAAGLLVWAWNRLGRHGRGLRARTEQVAYRMFVRNVADHAEPAMIKLAWSDPDIRAFWVTEAEAVAADLR